MNLFLLFFLCLSSCMNRTDHVVVQSPSVKKQRQKIAVLQKKRESAEKEQKKVQSEVEKLALEIDDVQLALIRRQLDDYERKKEKPVSLFLDEREALYRMIQTGPLPTALEAQAELDRILRVITELSDEGNRLHLAN